MTLENFMAKLSKYRGQVMGVCILGVLLGHSAMSVNSTLINIVRVPYWVVDIFFFLSGVGVYTSLLKDSDPLRFYKRRLKRIYPAYLPVALIYCAMTLPLLGENSAVDVIREVMGNITMLGWVQGTPCQLNWYPQAVMLFYFASPVIFMCVQKAEGKGKKLALILGFFVVTQLCFIKNGLLIAYSRTLPFILGIIMADLVSRGKELKINRPLVIILGLIGVYLDYFTARLPFELTWSYGLSWYPGVLTVVGLPLLMIWFFAFCEKFRVLTWISTLFKIMGKYSFEIFLVHLIVYQAIGMLGYTGTGVGPWLGIMALAVLISVCYGKAINYLSKLRHTANG